MKSFLVEPAAGPLAGLCTVPGDKSVGHRALLFGALADGAVRVRGLSGGVDNARTAAAMTAMGVTIVEDGDELLVHGAGVDGLRAPSGPLECGNSGTTMRLLCGLLAGQGFEVLLSGDESLSRRPMRRVIDPLARMGGSIRGEGAGAQADEAYPPLRVEARRGLAGVEYVMPVASAQVKSALILAALYATGTTRIIEPGSTRDHTERMLRHMGAPVAVRGGGVIEVSPDGWDRRLTAERFVVPADPSSAAFVVAAALVAGAERVTVSDVCTNPTRTGFLDVLAAMNALVEPEASRDGGGEPTADLSVSRGGGDALRGTVVAGDLTVRSIDELPVLAVIAARAEGETRFSDAAELRVKESDRIATTCAMLRGFGVEVSEEPDGFTVVGQGRGGRLRAARVDAAGDHRIAMAAVVGALAADGPVRVDDVDNVATSFPTFVEVMRALGVAIEEREG